MSRTPSVALEPVCKFDAMSPEQEALSVQFCEEISGKRGEACHHPVPVRLLEMAESLYLAEISSAGASIPGLTWSEIRAEVVRLKQREADLLNANNRYLQRARDAEASLCRLKAALQRIARWFGEFPETGKFWDNARTQPMSYSSCYGSNGERDFMRGIAQKALDDEEAEPI